MEPEGSVPYTQKPVLDTEVEEHIFEIEATLSKE
jgi:hypothetical protein